MAQRGQTEMMIVALTALPLLSALVLGCVTGRRKQNLPQDQKRDEKTRPMEFGSALMFLGCWPPDTRMEPPVITTFMYLDGVPDTRSMETACSKMLLFDNFRSLPQRCRRRWFLPALTKCEWREIKVKPVDIITRVQVEGSAMVLREMERIQISKLPQVTRDGRELPMWNLHVIENTDLTEGAAGLGSVVAFRFHHTIGDGMSLIAVARAVIESIGQDGNRQLKMGGAGVGAALATGSRSEVRFLSKLGIGKALSTMSEVIGLSFAASDTALPFGHLEGPIARGRHGSPWNPSSDQIRKRKAFSGRRRLILFPDIPLSLIQKIKKTAGVKVNDVMMCLLSGCIRRYCEGTGAGASIGGKRFKSRVIMPVALPRTMASEDRATVLCNRWGLASSSLHLDEPHPATRLEKIKDASTKMKNKSAGGIHYLLQAHVMPRLPLFVCQEMVYRSLATHSLFFSNVPGPQEPASFAGRRLRRIHFCFNNITPHVGVLSLDGAVGTTLTVDPVAVPDSLSLPSHYLDELKALMASLGVDDAKALAEAQNSRDQLLRIMEAVHLSDRE